MRRGLMLTAAAALAGAALWPGAPADAALCSYVTLTELSPGQIVESPSISDDGSRVAFASTANVGLGGTNGDGNQEIFIHDVAAQTNLPATDTAAGGASANRSPSLNQDGTAVAFDSNQTFGGSVNPEGNREVFIRTAGGLTEVTDEAVGTSENPSLNDDGTRVTFTGNADLNGINPNADQQLWWWTSAGPTTVRLGGATGGRRIVDPSINGVGNLVAFESEANFGGNNPGLDPGLWRVNVFSPTTPILLTITSPSRDADAASNSAGDAIAFGSDVDHDPPANSESNDELYLVEPGPPHTFTQLTDHPDDNDAEGPPAIDGAGTRVAFDSNGDLVGANADENRELYLRDTDGAGGVSQVTDTSGGSPNMEPSLSADGTRLAFVSDRDVTGDNADGSDELLLGYCGRATPSFNDYPLGSTFFDQVEWMKAAGVTTGFPDGTFRAQDFVKRQQMAFFLYNLWRLENPPYVPNGPTFVDYPPGSTFYTEVEWMGAADVATGFPDGTYRPQDFVKRQQMAFFLYNLAGQPEFDPPDDPTFVDYPPGSTFYKEVEWMAAEEIASGFPDQTFRPQDFVKRQQMANFLHNLAVGPGVEAGVL